MQLKSTEFKENGQIPQKYTCEGQNLSPPLQIEGVPEGAESLALILDDPDAPHGTFIHWVFWNVPPEIAALPEGVGNSPAGILGEAKQGKNSFGEIGYGGPCPPRGEHRYRFHLYALDQALSLPEEAGSKELVQAMSGHILAQVTLTGRYRKGQARTSP